jgi:hypothetical protein
MAHRFFYTSIRTEFGFGEAVASLTLVDDDKQEFCVASCALIEAVVLTPEDSDLAINLRGELASMLELCAGAETQKTPAGDSSEVLQMKMVAGTGSGRNHTLVTTEA